MAVDASVLIAHLDPADAHHTRSTALLLNGAPGAMLVHLLTLAEVLVGGVRLGRGVGMRDDVHAVGIRVAPHDVDESLRLAELRATTGLNMPDCCVLDVAMHHRASLATFDFALAAAARQRGLVVLP